MMITKNDFILECKNKIFLGQPLTDNEANKLINISKSELHSLANAANEITRKFQGNKVDVEQLSNIKKNFCSEDCSFCGQSAFFNTNVESYQLLSKEEVVKQAKKALDEGAQSYCLVAAWREPSIADFKKVCTIIEEVNKKVGISIECSLGFLTDQQAKE